MRAADIALQGVRREAAGRTTHHDRRSQCAAGSDQRADKADSGQRDRVIASYTLLSAVGRLDVQVLNLDTPDYLPEVHYHQVRDAWHGVRTPSGQ